MTTTTNNTNNSILSSYISLANNRTSFQSHSWHLVTSSPWPLLTSYALLLLPISLVLYFNGYIVPIPISSLILVIINLISTLIVITLWFRDVVIEGTILGNHTTIVQSSLSIGILLFIVSEFFFFVSIFWAYIHSSLAPAVEIGASWPPLGVDAINPFELPLLNTLLLLSSGATVTYSHHALIHNNRTGSIIGLFITLILAVLFTVCQGVEYYNAGFTLSDGVYGSTFYFGTGFHGLHVIIGTLFLAVAFGRILSYHLTNTHHNGYEGAILYWHFVDCVWLGLYVLVYWWGS